MRSKPSTDIPQPRKSQASASSALRGFCRALFEPSVIAASITSKPHSVMKRSGREFMHSSSGCGAKMRTVGFRPIFESFAARRLRSSKSVLTKSERRFPPNAADLPVFTSFADSTFWRTFFINSKYVFIVPKHRRELFGIQFKKPRTCANIKIVKSAAFCVQTARRILQSPLRRRRNSAAGFAISA